MKAGKATPKTLLGMALALSAIGIAAAVQAQSGPPTPEQIEKMKAAMGGKPEGAGAKDDKQEFPDFKEVVKDFVQVVSTADGVPSLYTIYKRDKDQQLLAELPRNFEQQRFFFAMTVASGTTFAGLQGPELYAYWKRFDKRLALIAPQIDNRSTGDMESKDSVAQVFTDRVILDIPILCMSPKDGPVIDLDALLVGQADKFFGPSAKNLNASITTIRSAKAFPENLELSFDAPISGSPGGAFGGGAPAGSIRTFHYSISLIRDNPAYKPRVADERVGYFTTVYRDLGKLGKTDKWVRYINRWNLQKADPRLKMSPPKQPIVFYVEHTVPIRYRRWVRDGVLWWNKAFEQVGLSSAIEVYYQDKATGAHMEKDPEDVRYNFLRWVSNDVSTAIGPSRANPLTGEILDADIILTDGWIRAFWTFSNEVLPDVATESMNPETLAWLESRPNWDPRIRLLPPAQREQALLERAQHNRRGIHRFAGVPSGLMKDLQEAGVIAEESGGWLVPSSMLCFAASGRAIDMSTMGMAMDVIGMLDDAQPAGPKIPGAPDAPKGDDDTKDDTLDGIPEWFIGPMLADLVAHEVGHTLGLRHNFKASAIYSMAQINSADVKGKKSFGGSVMDYNALPNVNMGSGEVQGDYGMIDIGPYDMWAIEYGYTFDDTKKVLERVADPTLIYATDEDTWGPDPFARRRDLGSDPLNFSVSRMKLAQALREKISDKFVKEGDSWSKARRGYAISLSQHLSAISTMANWVGGAYVSRDKKGDPNARPPIVPVAADTQRAALKFVCENAFRDSAFGLSPDLLNKMTVDKWWDEGGIDSIFEDETWPVHDRILAIQASALSMIMNPTVLGRVYDNEFRVPADQDMITLPEVVSTVSAEVWTEIDAKPGRSYTARQPMISSLRRNLQREYLDRLIDLSLPDAFYGSAGKVISTLSVQQLRDLQAKLEAVTNGGGAGRLDPYSLAHLNECKTKITKALDSMYIYNASQIGGAPSVILLGNDAEPAGAR